MKINKRVRIMVAGVLLAAILICGNSALAESVQRSIEVVYNDIKLVIDGKLVTPKDASGNIVAPFLYNGTTYLPVRAVSEALGKQVDWDGSTQTVYISGNDGGNSSVSPPSAPTVTPPASATVFEDSLTGILDPRWKVSGSVVSEGADGVRIGTTDTATAGALQLEDMLKPGITNYTIEFDAIDRTGGTSVFTLFLNKSKKNVEWDVNNYYGKGTNGNYYDLLIYMDNNGNYYVFNYPDGPDQDWRQVIKGQIEHSNGTYRHIKITASNGRYDLSVDGKYITSFDGPYDNPTLGYYARYEVTNSGSANYPKYNYYHDIFNIRSFKLTIDS
jgi:hypothetical protein